MPKKTSRKVKPMAARSTSRKPTKVVARNVSKRPKTPSVFSGAFWKTPRMLLVVILVALLGGYLLYKSFALTNTVTYSGSFTKKHPSTSYTITTTAPGVITATASYSNATNFRMSLMASGNSTTSVASTLSGANPQTLTTGSVPVGTYTLTLSATPPNKGSGSYTVTVSYPVADTVPPAVTITSPASDATLSGLPNLVGTATDNDGISKVEVSTDGGTPVQAALSGASTTNQTWSYLLDTTKLANGSHTVSVKATDLTGNTATTNATYTVSNSVTAPADTTAPTVSIANPTSGTTISAGSTTLSGTATDNVQVAKVEYQVDGGSWQPASISTPGASVSYSAAIITSTWNNGNHTITVKATDSSANIATSSVSFAVSNPTNPTAAPNTQGTWVSPEGVTITVNTTGPWTISQVYSVLKANALDLATVGPHYTVNVQDTYGDKTTVSSALMGGTYTGYKATTTLYGASGTQLADRSIAHEYGHAWSYYYYYLAHNGSWVPYENVRWTTADGSLTLLTDSRTNTSYTWQVSEIIADDYRLLFGTPAAIAEQPTHLNTDIPDPRNVPGLNTWLLNNWR